MTAFKLNRFLGRRPRLPDTSLAAYEASVADNCDFAYGELRATRGGLFFRNLANTAKSLYTEDGLTFYSWTDDVDAVRSPLANDTFNRMYFTGMAGGMRVANRLGTGLTGGPPASSYLVGVPRIAAAPILAAIAPTPINDTTATLAWTFHWESGAVKYQEQAVTLTTSNYQTFTLTPPAKAAGTPSDAVAVVRLLATSKSTLTTLADVYTENSAYVEQTGLYTLTIAPGSGGQFTVTLTAGVREADKETRAYVITAVNIYNEEGPPSPPAKVQTAAVLGATVSTVKPAVGGYAPIKEIRVYSTPTGSSIAEYFYKGSINVLSLADGAAVVFTDNVEAALTDEVLASTNYYPPDPGLVGLTQLDNGILMAWKGTELHFSEAYKPWAWSPMYVKKLPANVVGAIAVAGGAVVTTASYPHLISGVSPDAMTATKLNVEQAGVSKRSIAIVDGLVIYASHDGLVAMSGATASLAQGQKFFTREVWRGLYGAGLSSMQFAVWDGRLVVYSATNAFKAFMVRFDEADGAFTDLPEFVAQAHFVSPLSDQFYYAAGAGLYQFNGGDELSCVWQSGEMVIPRPVCPAVAQVVVKEGTWTFKLYAFTQDPTTRLWGWGLVHTEEDLLPGLNNFRLPAGYEATRFRIRVEGTGRLPEIQMAQSFRELAAV